MVEERYVEQEAAFTSGAARESPAWTILPGDSLKIDARFALELAELTRLKGGWGSIEAPVELTPALVISIWYDFPFGSGGGFSRCIYNLCLRRKGGLTSPIVLRGQDVLSGAFSLERDVWGWVAR